MAKRISVSLHMAGMIFFVGFLVLVTGCSMIPPEESGNITPSSSPAPDSSYRITLRQPEAQSAFIHMDSDVYNIGEVVEFTVTNDGSGTLECAGDPPSFQVRFQAGNGKWVTRMGAEPDTTKSSSLPSHASTQVYRYITTGWDAGRYRIVHDCGVERDILLRSLPPTPVPAPSCPNGTELSPFVTIDPIGDQYDSRPFTITGTTNGAAGQELKYSIFSVNSSGSVPRPAAGGSFITTVTEGTCGTNTWRAMGEIRGTGQFFIQVTDPGRNVTALRRFMVFSPGGES